MKVKDAWGKTVKFAANFFVRPWVPAVLGLFAPAAGAWTAFRHNSIELCLKYYLFENLPSGASNSDIATGQRDLAIFVGLLAFFMVGFSLHKWAEARINKERIDYLGKHSEAIRSLIESLPPQGFLERYRDSFEKSYRKILVALDKDDEAKNSIRVVLTNLLLLALSYDDQGTPSHCSINVMVFEKFPISDASRAGDLLKKVAFLEPPACDAALFGVLTLDTDLALIIDEGAPKLDTTVPQLVLPVPKEHLRIDNKERTTVLPGAPAAFCQNRGQFCDDTTKLARQMRKAGLRPAIREEIDGYFRKEGATIKSFLSLPMSIPVPDGFRQVGVINIHSDKPGMLRGVKGAQLFVPLAIPYCILLAQLLEKIPPPNLRAKGPG